MSLPIFTKSELLKDCVFDLDDAYSMWDRNALSELFWLKTKYPKMKVTLFTVPEHKDSSWEETKRLARLLHYSSDWIQLAMHGWTHETPPGEGECKYWTKQQTHTALDKWDELVKEYGDFVQAGFKAPGWQISDDTYKVLLERGYWVADHIYNEERRPKELKAYTLAHPWCFHGHTWDLPNADPAYQNGIRQLFQVHKLPWDEDTNFHWVSEVVK